MKVRFNYSLILQGLLYVGYKIYILALRISNEGGFDTFYVPQQAFIMSLLYIYYSDLL